MSIITGRTSYNRHEKNLGDIYNEQSINRILAIINTPPTANTYTLLSLFRASSNNL